jgi:hypothetical protein
MMSGFNMVDDKIMEGIKETDWKVRVYKNLFSIIFTLITLYTIQNFGINLKNPKLRIGLPIALSILLSMFVKYKYDQYYAEYDAPIIPPIIPPEIPPNCPPVNS